MTGEGTGTSGWMLPESMQDTTGVVYATSFPALDTAIAEVSKYFRTRDVTCMDIAGILQSLRIRLEKSGDGNALTADVEAALQQLAALASEPESSSSNTYEFDRKFLFRVLVLGNAQLAQIIKARGPNMQTNAACAGT